MATSPQPATPAAAAPASRFPRKMVLAAVAFSLLAAAGGGFFLLRGGSVQAASAPEPVKPVFVNLEPLTVNLRAEGKPRFLHVGVSLKVSDEKAHARINESMPELRSRLLLLLSNRDPATLATPDDKLSLAAEIRENLNRPLVSGLPAHGINGVGFNAFVIQ